MKKTQKRAFILNECKSPYISQAIFILKDGISSNHHGVIADAERIVASYMSDLPKIPQDNKKQLSASLTAVITALITVSLSVAFFLFISK
ncbi:MAG: hypothetical protein UIM24_07010 [Clostridia bacterium]|nr:hypothetical protein [Clostridia bacterium]